jgi:hypothetical protein
MQIMRLHWRSLMPWDRSPDNHLTGPQRRDYLMASLGWFRDLLMFGFTLLLLVIAGLLVSGSNFALMPLAGEKSLLPMSLIIVATVCMTWTLRHWTTITRRRAVMSLIVSLSASWITALACIEGMSRREGVFLRTSKTGSTHRPLRTAFRLTRWETSLSLALFVAAALLSNLRHPPLLLIFILSLQGLVYLCAPITSLWNLRARLVEPAEFRSRHEAKLARQASVRRRSFRIVRPVVAVFAAALVGGGIAVLAAPGETVPNPPTQHARVAPADQAPGASVSLPALGK